MMTSNPPIPEQSDRGKQNREFTHVKSEDIPKTAPISTMKLHLWPKGKDSKT